MKRCQRARITNASAFGSVSARVFGEQRRRRPEDFEAQRAGAQRRPGGDRFRASAGVARGGKEVAIEAPVDEPGDRQPPERFGDPGPVVGLVVGDDRGPEPLDALVVELRDQFVPRRPTVDEHRRRAPRLQQDRVPLADVEHLDP